MGVWSEALRQELQPDIRVMLIEPAAVATELTDHVRRDLVSRVDGLGLPVTALVPRQQSLRDATEDGSDVTLAVGMGGGF
jgi:NADP-dependent 3-hydroxy acid dehydrogenase YdfG